MRRWFALLVAGLATFSAPGLGRAEEGAAASAADTATPSATAAPSATSAATGTGIAVPEQQEIPTASATAAALPRPPEPARAPRRDLPMFGLSVGGGFPDLVNANLLFRPISWARLYAGPCWGYVSWGMQGGVVLAPWNGVVTPTLSLQAGELFSTNLTRFLKSDSQSAQDVKPLLGNVDYRYLAGDLGLEVGSPRGFSFYLRLGLSFVVIKANGAATHTANDGTRVTIRDPSVSAWLPSTKLGFQYWF
jgi:hypothetical protein